MPKFPPRATIVAARPCVGAAGNNLPSILGPHAPEQVGTVSPNDGIVHVSASNSRFVVRAALCYRDAAEYISVSVGTLSNWVSAGKGPTSILLGKRGRRFRVADLDTFLSSHLVLQDSATHQQQPRRRGRPAKTEEVVLRRRSLRGV